MPAKAAAAKSGSLSHVYDHIEKLLKRYSPPFAVGPGGKVGSKRHYDLISRKGSGGDGKPELWFASVIEQKDYIGFYFMAPAPVRDRIAPCLLKLLKGKSCFHIKAVDAELLAEMKAALDLGLAHYKREGRV